MSVVIAIMVLLYFTIGCLMVVLIFHQVLCPRCDIGTLGFKRKTKKLKEPLPNGKKKSTKLENLSDLERALSESKETSAAVRVLLTPNTLEIKWF